MSDEAAAPAGPEILDLESALRQNLEAAIDEAALRLRPGLLGTLDRRWLAAQAAVFGVRMYECPDDGGVWQPGDGVTLQVARRLVRMVRLGWLTYRGIVGHGRDQSDPGRERWVTYQFARVDRA